MQKVNENYKIRKVHDLKAFRVERTHKFKINSSSAGVIDTALEAPCEKIRTFPQRNPYRCEKRYIQNWR